MCKTPISLYCSSVQVYSEDDNTGFVFIDEWNQTTEFERLMFGFECHYFFSRLVVSFPRKLSLLCNSFHTQIHKHASGLTCVWRLTSCRGLWRWHMRAARPHLRNKPGHVGMYRDLWPVMGESDVIQSMLYYHANKYIQNESKDTGFNIQSDIFDSTISMNIFSTIKHIK